MTGIPFETEIRVELASIKGDLGGVKHSQTMIMACMGVLVAIFAGFMIYQAQELSAVEDRVQSTHDQVVKLQLQGEAVTKRLDAISSQVEAVSRQIAAFKRTDVPGENDFGKSDEMSDQIPAAAKAFDPNSSSISDDPIDDNVTAMPQ